MVAEGGGLVEHVQVAESELLLNSFSHLDDSLIITISAIVGAQFDGASTNFTIDGELNVLGVGSDLHCL